VLLAFQFVNDLNEENRKRSESRCGIEKLELGYVM
jgi:hypothetical protein